ncbi:M23 family metallopeptidase [Brevibacillus reuszeri]|uniref:M23 family metallopeptidase n=1 Tax=Brevibacillus reuszeri TaxID=54915 RepID=UPI003D1BDCED
MPIYDTSSIAERIPLACTTGQFGLLYEACSISFREEVSKEEFCSYASSFHHDIFRYQPTPASVVSMGGIVRYVWISDNNQKGLSAAIDVSGTIIGLRLAHLAEYPITDQLKSHFRYRFPFHGEWFTYWGGKNDLVNYHYAYENQRYAYDFIILDHDCSAKGDPLLNESYFAYGKPILAPCAGRIVRVVDNIPDNVPGRVKNEQQPAGNYVEMDHGHHEFSLLAHLQYHSITVVPGNYVQAGDVIGLCGNSGNSSEPHLHFQVSNGSELLAAKSIPFVFENGLELVQGMTVIGK